MKAASKKAGAVTRVLVALLRGINVGKAKRIAMADLRTLLEGLGYEEVRTLLNSGNAVFSAADAPAEAARRIEGAIQEKLGITSRVMVVTAGELAVIARENSLQKGVDNPSRLMVAFPGTRGDLARLKPLLKDSFGDERLAVGTAAAYLWLPEGVIVSQLAKAVDRALGDSVTTRNWATVQKLGAMASG